MFSRELLSEVYNFEVKEIIKLGIDEATYEVRFNGLKNGLKYNIINIYELANKCKEWAYSKGYGLSVHTSEISGYIVVINCGFTVTDFHNSSEPEAIFKACEWILKDSK